MTADIERICLSPEAQVEEQQDVVAPSNPTNSLRPELFKDYPGQEKVKENLKVYVEASKKRNGI